MTTIWVRAAQQAVEAVQVYRRPYEIDYILSISEKGALLTFTAYGKKAAIREDDIILYSG